VDVQTPDTINEQKDKSQERRDARRRHLEWLGIEDGQLIELQTLAPVKDGLGFVAFTTSIGKAIALADDLTTPERFNAERRRPIEYQGVYIVPNAHVDAMQYMIANDEWWPTPKGLTTDDRIAYRRAFYLDLDTKRPNDLPISATDAELKATLLRARAIIGDIKDELSAVGIETPAHVIGMMMSGNGVQAWFRLGNLPNTPALSDTIKRLLAVWSVLFDAPEAHVDTSVFDPKRIAPICGTPKRKASNTKERPHRFVTFTGSSTPRALTSDELAKLLESYEARLTPEQAAAVEKLGAASDGGAVVAGPQQAARRAAEDRGDALGAVNKVPIREVGARLGLDSDKPICPGCGSGGGSDVAYLDGLGANVLNCKHARCATRPNRTPVDLVAKVAFGCDSIKGTKGLVPKVLAWFETNFAVKAASKKKSGILDSILASEDDDVALGGGAATDETTATSDTETGSFAYTDDGNALMFVTAFVDKVIYVEEHETFYVWDGTHWEKDPARDRVIALMRTLARRMFEVALKIEDDAARGLAVTHARKSQSERSIKAAVNLAKTDDRIRIDADVLDSNPDLLVVENGTLDLSCRPPKLRDHDPKDYLTKVVGIAYDEHATCPEFEKAVAATSADPEVVAFRWRRFASYLDGHPDQYIVIAWGLPGTGKSTVHEEIATVLGPHARKVPKSIFETTHHEQHPADIATLEGKRFVYGAEIKPYLNVDRINELTGDATVSARGMRENWRDIAHTWKMTFYTNKKPVIRADAQNGIWRRTIFDPWTVKIAAPRDPDVVKATFKKERAGILARLVRMYAEYQEKGLAPPASIMAATNKFKADQDRFRAFFEKHTDTTDKTAVTPFADLWKRLVTWKDAHDPDMKISKKGFALDLDARGIVGAVTEDKAKTDIRIGIKLLDVTTAIDASGVHALPIDEEMEVERLLDEAGGGGSHSRVSLGGLDEMSDDEWARNRERLLEAV
jgi:putative DNA primase/helicase